LGDCSGSSCSRWRSKILVSRNARVIGISRVNVQLPPRQWPAQLLHVLLAN
jgi:hypothetical protein